MWKDAVTAYFELLSKDLPGGMGEGELKKLQDSLYLDQGHF
jgi:hypothetical protein